ncbi:hypothetical protein LZ198_25560 [Myxococcus sp. K15C18031901]|uniref:hypothetical protein n=1 Tax=Myxococcus dinghuensis TaxID=2906761 RepID=UPI0020A8155F|nr:hypothetical protein [Myxococcus dinghuensis]MCP3102241.1 hypothetical protein [Myxococcus dinghuensis]
MTDLDTASTLDFLNTRYAEHLAHEPRLRVEFFLGGEDFDGALAIRVFTLDANGAIQDLAEGRTPLALEQLPSRGPRLDAFCSAHARMGIASLDARLGAFGDLLETFSHEILLNDRLQSTDDFLKAMKKLTNFDILSEPDPEHRVARRDLAKNLTGERPALFRLLESATPAETALDDVLDRVREELGALTPEQRADLTPWLIVTFDDLLGWMPRTRARPDDIQVRYKGKRVFYKATVAQELGRFYEQWTGIPLVPTKQM